LNEGATKHPQVRQDHPQVMPGTAQHRVHRVTWRVQQGFLDAALDAVDADHGGIEKYLRGRLGLSDAALRELATRYLHA